MTLKEKIEKDIKIYEKRLDDDNGNYWYNMGSLSCCEYFLLEIEKINSMEELK